MTTTFPARLFITAALTLTATLGVLEAAPSTATPAAAPALASYVVPADDTSDSDTANNDQAGRPTTTAQTQDRVVAPTVKSCTVIEQCPKPHPWPAATPPGSHVIAFQVIGGGTTSSITTTPGATQYRAQVPFLKVLNVTTLPDELGIHVVEASQANDSCRITLDGKLLAGSKATSPNTHTVTCSWSKSSASIH